MSKVFEAFQRWKLEQTHPVHTCRRCVHLTRGKTSGSGLAFLGECNLSGHLIMIDDIPEQCASFYTAAMDD